MKKIKSLLAIAILIGSIVTLFGQEGNVPKDLLNDQIWMDGQTRNIFGYPVTRMFGTDNISSERYHGNRFASETRGGLLSVTNVGYLTFDDVLKDLQKAWSRHDISLPVQKYLEDSLRNVSGGGYIYVYIERPSQDAANFKYYFTVVRDENDNKKFYEFQFPRQTSQMVGGKGNWWNYYVIPMASIPKFPFYIYVNDKQTEDLSDYKFRVDSPDFWETVTKTVKLIPDETFAQGNNWNKVFESYTDTMVGKQIGKRKSLIVLPDGSTVVSHSYRDYYTLFDKNGKFVKEFGIKKDGKILKKIKPIKGIINNNILFTTADNMGKINCFDFDGNFVKTLTLDYSVHDMVALNPQKIAVVGSTSWGEKWRYFVSIVDYNTNEEKIVWEHFEDHNMGKNKENKAYIFMKRYIEPSISCIDNHLIIAFPTMGGIMIFDSNGKLKSNEKINWVKYISVEEQKAVQRKKIEDLENSTEQRVYPPIDPKIYNERKEELIKELKTCLNQIVEPLMAPAFSTIIKTSDEKLLFFEIPEKEGENRFHVWVYEKTGKFAGKYTFVCDDYELSITPSKMVFYNGFIYALQDVKNGEGVPMRLVRFRVEGM